jgi:hypothetical protein
VSRVQGIGINDSGLPCTGLSAQRQDDRREGNYRYLPMCICYAAGLGESLLKGCRCLLGFMECWI